MSAPAPRPTAAALALMERALDLAPSQRADFVRAQAAGDAALEQAVLALLAAHAGSAGFLEPPSVPRELGPYRLIAPIGAGGMGQVWLAERDDGAYRQRVAIKILASVLGDPDALRRAAAERQFLAWLDHPHIARVLDGGTTPQGQPYVVMDYVEGARIDAWCRERRLDPAARVRLFLQVLDAVDAAHRALIIHRDIKPANVLVDAAGQAKLLDFGIAKSLDAGRGLAATRTGLTPMTPEYASPEQLAGEPLTTASDVYSLGLLLCELLCGAAVRAAGTSTPAQRAQAIAQQPPTRPSRRVDAAALGVEERLAADWRRRIAGDLDRVVVKALAPEPPRRYASARAFAEDLQRWLERRPVLARDGGMAYRLGKFVQRHRLGVAAGGAAALALGIGLALAAVQARRAAEEGERALRANRFLSNMIASADPYVGGKPPLLVDALDRAARTIPQELAGQPLLEADIRRAIGHAYLVLERNDAAREQLERAVRLRERSGGTDYAKALDSLGLLEWQVGRYAEAERLLRQGLEACEDDARGRQQRAELLNDLSSLEGSLGRYADALAMAQTAQAIKLALPDTPPRELAVGASNIASALDGLGRYAESRAAYAEAIRRFEAIRPLPELDLSIALNNLAYLENETGHVEAAVAAQERALALRRAVMGPDYPRLATPLSNLALQYIQLGRQADADRAIADALRLAPQVFAAADQLLGHLHVAAANVALAGGDKAAARHHAQQALDIYAKAEAVEPGRREKAQQVLDRAR